MEYGTEGPPRLSAVLQGFQLLNTALQYDQGAAEAINSMTVRERVAPLHTQLVHPQRRLAVLLQYVLYTNMDLQYEVRDMCAGRKGVCVCWRRGGREAKGEVFLLKRCVVVLCP